jgi:hypothetical protein
MSKLVGMGSLSEASQDLVDLVFFGLDRGVDTVRDGRQLLPFVVTEDGDGERGFARYIEETLEGSLTLARTGVRGSGAKRAVLVYDGFSTQKGERSQTVLLEAYEIGAPDAIVVGQRYKPRGAPTERFEVIGNPAELGTSEPLF